MFPDPTFSLVPIYKNICTIDRNRRSRTQKNTPQSTFFSFARTTFFIYVTLKSFGAERTVTLLRVFIYLEQFVWVWLWVFFGYDRVWVWLLKYILRCELEIFYRSYKLQHIHNLNYENAIEFFTNSPQYKNADITNFCHSKLKMPITCAALRDNPNPEDNPNPTEI